MGVDPYTVLNQGNDDYLITIAFLQKAMKLSVDRKAEEIKVLAELTGLKVAEVFSKIF